MSGVAGFVEFGKKQADLHKLKLMTDIIKHRGPDAEGHYIYENIALGHRYLSLSDQSSTERQPMISHDGCYCIVFEFETVRF